MTKPKKGKVEGAGFVYCWSCGTDLRRINELHHKEIGHKVEWLLEHPKKNKKIDENKLDN